jgi:hypothetical protein
LNEKENAMMSERIIARHDPKKNRSPDPENGSPGAVATATGADRKAGVLKEAPENYLSFADFVQSESATVIYHGQKLIGTIIRQNGWYDAFDLHRRCLGSFRNRIDAIRAVRRGAVS